MGDMKPIEVFDLTDLFCHKDGEPDKKQSKYGEGVIYRMTIAPDSWKTEELSDGMVRIAGYASTKEIDSYNDIILPQAYKRTITPFKQQGGTMLFMHDWWAIPVGQWETLTIDENGLWVEGRTIATTAGKDVAVAIREGTLKALSVGFRIVKSEFDHESEIRTIKDLDLFEISVVHRGANPGALFQQVKSQGDAAEFIRRAVAEYEQITKTESRVPESADAAKTKEEPIMSNIITDDTVRKAEELVKAFPDFKDTVSTELADLQKNIAAQARLLKEVQEKAEQATKGLISADEYKTFAAKIGADILELSEKIDKGQKARTIMDSAPSVMQWRADCDITIVRDEKGNPLSPMEQKAYHYFQMPMKADSAEGELMKLFRRMNDQLVVLDALQRQVQPRWRLEETKTWQNFVKLGDYLAQRGIISPEFAKALSSSTSGSGSQFVPTLLGAEYYDYYMLSALTEAKFEHFDPQTRIFDWPLLTSLPTVYRRSEATTNNPAVATRTSPGTSKVTFTLEVYAAAVPTSFEFVEDSAIPVVPLIIQASAKAHANSFESVIYNGDSTATHFDTGAGYTSLNPETYEKGLRRLASDASKTFDVQSTSVGVGDATAAFHGKDWTYLLKLAGAYGANPNEGFFWCSVAGYNHTLNMAAFSEPGTYGAGSAFGSGKLDQILGRQLVVSPKISDLMNASGIYDNSTKTYTVVGFCNPTAFRIAEAKGVGVEFERYPTSGQLIAVTTARKSFKCLESATTNGYPSTVGYKVPY